MLVAINRASSPERLLRRPRLWQLFYPLRLLSHVAPLASRRAVSGLQFWITHPQGGTVTFFRPPPTSISPIAIDRRRSSLLAANRKFQRNLSKLISQHSTNTHTVHISITWSP